jgi:transketolase
MRQRVVFIYTHDSVGLGEDGPTHQPVEQLAGLRALPGLVEIRPADAAETAQAWCMALKRHDGPTALILTRQKLPPLDRKELASAEGVRRGGYVLWQAEGDLKVILIATGSEVHIALEAAKMLAEKGIAARLVSLPSWELFDRQPQEYRDGVLPPQIEARVSIEAAATFGWERYIGDEGIAIGVDRFGASAPYQRIYQELGLTPQHVVQAAEKLLKRT